MSKPRSRIEDLTRGTLRYCHRKGLATLETCISWPVPVKRDSRRYLRFLLYHIGSTQNHQVLYPPFLAAWVDYHTGEVTSCEAYEGTADEPVGIYPYPAVSRYSPQEVRAMRDELYELYDHLMTIYDRSTLSVKEWEVVDRFVALFSLLQEPYYARDYYALNPDFFTWLTERLLEKTRPEAEKARPVTEKPYPMMEKMPTLAVREGRPQESEIPGASPAALPSEEEVTEE